MKTEPIVVIIPTIRCQTCGHEVSAIHYESAQASMLEHLVYSHSGETHDEMT